MKYAKKKEKDTEIQLLEEIFSIPQAISESHSRRIQSLISCLICKGQPVP